MRVHLVVHRFPPEAMGGTELYTLHLAHGLLAEGHQVTVLTHAQGDSAQVTVREDIYEGIPVKRLSFAADAGHDLVREEYDNHRVAAAVRRLWEAERPDLVHVTHFGYLSTSLVEVAATLGIPWLATLTDFWAICPNGRLLRADGALCSGPDRLGECARCLTTMGPRGMKYAALGRALPAWSWPLAARAVSWPLPRTTPWAQWLLALDARSSVIRQRLMGAQALLCPGGHAREILIANGYPPGLIQHAPHGIRHPETLRRDDPPSQGPVLRLGYLGPLDPAKGAHLPMEALARLPPDVPVSLTYRGSLPAERSANTYAGGVLRAIASSDRAYHGGPYQQNDLPQVLHALDVLIVPSIWYENTPTVIYEAIAAGVPVIATNLGGMRELVCGLGGGWLFPRGDPAALASLIRELALDRGRVQQVADNMAPVPTFAAHLERVRAVYASMVGAQS